MKKLVGSLMAVLVLFTPVVTSAQQPTSQTALPPCQPGTGTFLFANWPCDPSASLPPVPPPPPVEPPVSTLPPCAPGDGVFLFGNWPCDPSLPYVPPTPSPTMVPCPRASMLDPMRPCVPPPPPTPPPPPPCWWRWPCPKPIAAHYVALGDSIAYGLISFKGYVFRYQEALEEKSGGAIDTHNMSAPGVSSNTLLANLTSNTMMQEQVAQADYITWNVGGKDLLDAREQYQTSRCGGEDNQDCLRQTSQKLKENWTGIVSQVQNLRRPNATVATMDIYNPFVEEDRARDSWPNDAGSDFDVFKPYLDDSNRHLRTSSASAGIHVAHIFLAFNGPAGTIDPKSRNLISFDGFHPNDKGHTLIANLLDPTSRQPYVVEEPAQ